MRLYVFAVAAAMLSASLVARADSLIGSTVDVTYDFPELSNVATDSGPVVVTTGLEIVSPNNANLTFTSGNQITVTNPGLGSFSIFDFNGFDISILSGATIHGVSVDPSSDPAFDGVNITFTGNDLQINFSGACSNCGAGDQNLVLDIVTTPPSTVPEPSSFMLLGTGVFGLAGAARRRFAA